MNKQTQYIMGMPITVTIIDPVDDQIVADVFTYFRQVDAQFSTYKEQSEISKINRGEIGRTDYSLAMKTVFDLAEQTKHQTNGYFDIRNGQTIDPSGLVKGWSIYNAAKLLDKAGLKNYAVEAGGDVQVRGTNQDNTFWQIGIRNPFNHDEIAKVVQLTDCGIATSGTAERGQHIYNPKKRGEPIIDIKSLSVIGPNVYEADRFATAAFAMGKAGIHFINGLSGFAGYMIDSEGMATATTSFHQYEVSP